MNIERYLLRRVLFVRNVHDLSELFKDIEEVLAKPEQEPEPLSNDEITKLWRDNTGYLVSHNQFARAIEKAHGIGE